MRTPTLRRLGVAFTVLSLFVAACGGGDDADVTDAVSDTAEPADTAGSDPTPSGDPAANATDEDVSEPDGSEADGEGFAVDGEVIASEELHQAALEEGEFLFYSGWPEEGQIAILEEFEEDTGIGWELLRLASGRLYERIVTEHGGDQLEADAIFIADLSLTRDLVDRELFEPYEVPWFEEVPDHLKHADAYYYSGLTPCIGIIYNTELVDPADAPTSWEDITNEQWRGQIGLLPPDTGGNGWSTWMQLRNMYGVEFWEMMAQQEANLYTSTVPLTEDIVRGEVVIGVGLISNAALSKAAGAPIEVVYPEEGAICYSTYLGVSTTANNPNAAQLFINWSLSRVGSEAAGAAAGEYPVHPEAEAPVIADIEAPPLAEANFPEEDPDAWVELRETWIPEWNELFNYSA